MSVKFQVGDVVRLNSGSPDLLVLGDVTGFSNEITVVWIQESGYGKLQAAPVCFTLVRRAHEEHPSEFVQNCKAIDAWGKAVGKALLKSLPEPELSLPHPYRKE